jgi:hypothetical protein
MHVRFPPKSGRWLNGHANHPRGSKSAAQKSSVALYRPLCLPIMRDLLGTDARKFAGDLTADGCWRENCAGNHDG